MNKQEREERNRLVFDMKENGFSYRDISRTLGISKTMAHKIINSTTSGWGNLVKESGPEEPVISINTRSLRDIAIYLEGIKHGKGDLLPLGNVVLADLWNVIDFLNKKQFVKTEGILL